MQYREILAQFVGPLLRIVKAMFACIGLLIMFQIFSSAAAIWDHGNRYGAQTMVWLIFPFVAVWTCWKVMKRDRPPLEDIVAKLKKQVWGELKRTKSTRSEQTEELQYVERRIAKMKASIPGLADTGQRLLEYQTMLNERLWCPRCWIRSGVNNPLAAEEPGDFSRINCISPKCTFALKAPNG